MNQIPTPPCGYMPVSAPRRDNHGRDARATLNAQTHCLGALALLFIASSLPAQNPPASDAPTSPTYRLYDPMPYAGCMACHQLLHAETPVPRTPDLFLEVKAPDAHVTAVLADGTREVFPHKSAAEGTELLHLSLEPSLGSPDAITSVTITVADDVQPEDVRVVPAANLSDAQLLAAQPLAPLTLRYHALPNTVTPQTAVVAIHPELARRYEGAKIVLSLNERPVTQADLEPPPAGQHFVLAMNLPTFGNPGDKRTTRAELRHPDGRSLLIGQQAYLVLPEDRPFAQFEAPFQAIHSFELYQPVSGDLTVVAVHNRLYEPYGGPLGHEIKTHTLSLKTGTFESHELWRVPNHGHYAAGGFGDLALQEVPNAQGDPTYALFASALDAEGTLSIAWAAGVGTSVMRAATVQPLYTPLDQGRFGPTVKQELGVFGIDPSSRDPFNRNPSASSDFADVPGGPRTMEAVGAGLGLAVRPFGNGFLLLHASPDPTASSFAAAVSSRLREWTGIGPAAFGLKHGGHLWVDQYATRWIAQPDPSGSTHAERLQLALTDNPAHAYSTVDPIRQGWQPVPVSFPPNGSAFQIAFLDGQQYLFWLESVEGKSLLRWQPAERAVVNGISVPKLVE